MSDNPMSSLIKVRTATVRQMALDKMSQIRRVRVQAARQMIKEEQDRAATRRRFLWLLPPKPIDAKEAKHRVLTRDWSPYGFIRWRYQNSVEVANKALAMTECETCDEYLYLSGEDCWYLK